MRKSTGWSLLVLAGLASRAAVWAGDSEPPKVSPTRPELKAQLEGSKKSRPRLPLPAPTDAELAAARSKGAGTLPGIVNNGRMRKLYLPAELVGGGFTRNRQRDPAPAANFAFNTKLFWIVSRGNNCIYCQGHQEAKLASAGVAEDVVAALDGAWTDFTPAEQAAFRFTKKLTLTPHLISNADVDALRPHYSDQAITEMIVAVAGFNAMNRWTGSLAIPQEPHRVFLTPTQPRFESLRSSVAPLDPGAQGLACAAPAKRKPLESPAEVEAALKLARSRKPRLPLASEAQAAAVVEGAATSPAPAWERLLALVPDTGKPRIELHKNAETAGKLDKRLRAEIAWIAARNDRAWYALDIARKRLAAFGLTGNSVFTLDQSGFEGDPGRRLVHAFARKLTVDPALIEDDDVENLRRHFSDHEVAEIIFQITEAAFFDRLTEAAGLPLDN